MQRQLFKAYHPMLPSIVGARADYSTVTSDHVPILATIPLSEVESSLLDRLKVVSWNVLENDKANGFAPLGQGAYGESEEERRARHHRIKEAIVKFVKEQKPQFLALQEIGAYGELYRSIMQALQAEYGVVTFKDKPVDVHGCLTLYRKDEIEPVEVGAKSLGAFKFSLLEGNQTKYRLKHNPDRVIKILNAHPGFESIPLKHEQKISEFLTKEEGRALSIAVGDFNCAIAPLDNKPRNIATSATVSTFRKGQFQGACAIDGCFYANQDVDGRFVLRQAMIEHLNPQTGKIYHQDELVPLDVDQLPKLQKKEILDFQMVVCVDHSFYQNKIIEGMTVFEYEQYLKNELDYPFILVRPARNLNNDQGLGIILPNECIEYIKQKKDNRFQFRQMNKEGNLQAVFVDKQDIHLLKSAINDYFKIYDELYQTLIKITGDYQQYLINNPSVVDADEILDASKSQFVFEVFNKLKSSEKCAFLEKKKVIDEVQALINQDRLLRQDRGSSAKQYLTKMAVAIAVVVFPVGATLAVYHKIKYNTARFWTPRGYKRQHQMLGAINSANKKARLKK